MREPDGLRQVNGPRRADGGFHKRTGGFRSCLAALNGLILALSVLGFLGASFWLFELLTVFRFAFFILSALLLCVFLLRRQKTPIVIAACALLLNAGPVWPSLAPLATPVPPPVAKTGAKMTLLLANLYKQNYHHERFFQVLKAEKPDVVALVEVKAHWREALLGSSYMRRTYPFFFINPSGETALFSRLPLLEPEIRLIQNSYAAQSFVQTRILAAPGKAAGLVLIHPPHATSEINGLRQEQLFSYLLNQQQTLPKPLILAGDFNMPPWSNRFIRVKDGLRLSDSRSGFGLQASWPMRLGPVRLGVPLFPIDHILTGRGVVTAWRKTGPDIVSDHLPVVATLLVQ
jgi:endonuclease/exonuclease/phosphatase (EEP) superfamily protein YafD